MSGGHGSVSRGLAGEPLPVELCGWAACAAAPLLSASSISRSLVPGSGGGQLVLQGEDGLQDRVVARGFQLICGLLPRCLAQFGDKLLPASQVESWGAMRRRQVEARVQALWRAKIAGMPPPPAMHRVEYCTRRMRTLTVRRCLCV